MVVERQRGNDRWPKTRHSPLTSGKRRAVGEGAFASASASKAEGFARAMERASGTRAARVCTRSRAPERSEGSAQNVRSLRSKCPYRVRLKAITQTAALQGLLLAPMVSGGAQEPVMSDTQHDNRARWVIACGPLIGECVVIA